MKELAQWLNTAEPGLYTVIAMITSILCGILLHWITVFTIRLFDNKDAHDLSDILQKRLRMPSCFLFPAMVLSLFMFSFPLQESSWHRSLQKFDHLLLIFSLTFMVARLLYVLEDLVLEKYNMAKDDNYHERKLITQVQYLRKIAIWIVIFIGFSLMLMSFESVRKIGSGMLTSAGIAGIIIGFASQKLLANLLAGIQIAFTQPIKIDDVVVVEGEWGRIEEINLTYIVVKIWDLRRLVLPITYFVEKPFQNWTRNTAQIIGVVFIYADYTLPIEKIRHYLGQLVADDELWDGQTYNMQVTNATPDTIEVRVLVSARNSSQAWDLRCKVREKLIAHLQECYPDSLPRTRVSLLPEEKSATGLFESKVDKKK
jgi:small-conductance mechanosensitive channel